MIADGHHGAATKFGRWGEGVTPFRYPGGKAFLYEEIKSRIERGGEDAPRYYAEPYAGGAGAAIKLLASQTVDQVFLNDYDWRIFCAWTAILDNANRFAQLIETVTLDVSTWRRMHEVVANADEDTSDPFEVGFATFYLNRTNRSGIIVGAGPIGGYGQTGKWKIDARFPREALSARVKWLGRNRERITLSNMDGLAFLKQQASARGDNTFFFIDPPYVKAGSRLYMDAMSELLHLNLAKFLIENSGLPNWLVTYDDHPLIRSAYSRAYISELDVRYTLQKKRKAGELLITQTD